MVKAAPVTIAANVNDESSILKSISPNQATASSFNTAAPATGAPIAMGPPKFRPASLKTAFPIAHLPALLRAIQGKDKPAKDMLKELYDQFTSVTTQIAIRTKFETVASRTGARSGMWVVNDEAWVS